MASPSNAYVSNIRWDVASQAGIRITRLFAAAMLARNLSEYEFGIVALVIGLNDILKVFTHNGLVDQLVQVDSKKRLNQLLPSAFTLSLLISACLCLVSICASYLMPYIYSSNSLFLPILCMSFTYLFIPLSLVPTTQIMRSNKLRPLSITLFLSTSFDNLLSAILALSGFGLWSVVIPRLFVSPLWSLILYCFSPWRPPHLEVKYFSLLFSFSSKVLFSETLIALQSNLDYFLLGYFLGESELGLYYFAFNAGLGFTLSLASALLPSFYVDLCSCINSTRELRSRFKKNILTMMKVFVPVVFLQVLLAPIYVPIVFGEEWLVRGAVPILQIICLSALARPLARATTYLARAVNKPIIDTMYQSILTLILVLSLLYSMRFGVLGASYAILLVHIIIQLAYFWITPRYLLRSLNP